MSNSHTLKIEFEGPEHGWLRMTLRAHDQECALKLSYVPNDVVIELVWALQRMLDGEPDAVAHGNSEPTEYTIRFQRSGEELTVTVEEAMRSLTGRWQKALFSFTGTLREVVRPFWKALRDMEGRQSLEEYGERWSWNFPEQEMKRLTERIKAVQ